MFLIPHKNSKNLIKFTVSETIYKKVYAVFLMWISIVKIAHNMYKIRAYLIIYHC